MQSIAPVPVPQSMQNQVRTRTPIGMKRVVQNYYHEAQADTPSSLQEMSVDNDLRAQLAAVISTGQHQQQRQHPHSHTSHAAAFAEAQASASASSHDNNIDPAIGGAGAGSGNALMIAAAGGSGNGGGDSGGDDMNDGRKNAKRELSQSKRAAQNRAAQRAFRQRKEGYIKKLEEQVRELHNLTDSLKASQSENYSLREYIIHLQSRLIESQGEFPQPPPNINLAHPHSRLQHHAPVAPMNSIQANAARSLAATATLTGTKQEPFDQSRQYKSSDPSVNDDERLRSQLQATSDGMPGTI
ncbi:putative transcription factor kapC [Golovinomyces cichoracearum]|uniref:Putative transcription factor kapC n=1 Tax=Golovinomyces cichoracearum TaxID=62708 RepID=A0A420H8G5_9PEZI|nr:putative transcription factor kapC [Golovinomyces cichoracearum]